MGVSILDAHPNNECVDLSASEVWFSFIFCGSRINTLNLHAYDYYTGKEIVSGTPNTIYSPSIHTNLAVRGGVGNGVRVNIKDFVEDAESVFDADGEYTWRAELVQSVDVANGIYPDNMVYEGTLMGEPTLSAVVANVKGFDYDSYLPITPDISDKIQPPYYVDFLDSKYNGSAYDIPITYDETRIDDDGIEYTAIKLTTYSSTVEDTDVLLRPAVGTQVLVHKKKNYGYAMSSATTQTNIAYIDENISYINDEDSEISNSVNSGCYLKVGSEYFKILSYDKTTGAVTCQNADKLRSYPAGTHYAIYTTQFWTPHYYFRVHNMPKLVLSAEFHEHRRTQSGYYDDTVNCLENTFDGVLFKAELEGDSHAAVKYFYWEIFNAETGKRLLKTERMYSQEMDCEFFLPFGNKYTGRITVVTQDGITLRDEVSYDLPSSPIENDAKFKLRAIQNAFGGIELAWTYNYWYDGGSLLKANQFEVFRIDKRLNKVKYLGKVDCSPFGIDGVEPAVSGSNWYLIDESCDFSLHTPVGAKINMYLVGGGSDGGNWNVTPNDSNKSFAVSTSRGQGGCVFKKTITASVETLDFSAKVAERNDNTGTALSVNDTTYNCNDSGYFQNSAVRGNTMTQSTGSSVIYNDNAGNGVNGFVTPYGYVGSSGGGGAACGGNRTSGEVKTLSVSGVTPKFDKGNWLLIDRESLGGETGDFELNVPDGVTIRMYLVGGGSDGTKFVHNSSLAEDYDWDNNGLEIYKGYGGGYVLEKEITVSGNLTCTAAIADANDIDGTTLTIGSTEYKCSDSGSIQRAEGRWAIARHPRSGDDQYEAAQNGANGVNTPYGYVGSSGGGGGIDNGKSEAYPKCWSGGAGGIGAGDGGSVLSGSVTNGGDAVNYGCGGGSAAAKELSYYDGGTQLISDPGKGMPGCIILEISAIEDAPCPDPGTGGIGAGNGGDTGLDGGNAINYGCGGGGSGYWAVDSDGNYTIGSVGQGKKGCVIIEIDLEGLDSGSGEQVYAVDWTAASDKEYQYVVTGCNYESDYLTTRHEPEDMIECTAAVDITPHFGNFFIYFLNDADVLCETNPNYENYETPLIETMGRYVTSKNNNYRMIKRHNHTLSLERDDKSFYRRHTWRIEGDVTLGEVTHNITREISSLYAQMPSAIDSGTNYDSFPIGFLFGYLDCEDENGSGFVYDDQYLFELWKKCVFEKRTVMIKDPKGNVWTGTFNSHSYEVEYDTDGMPYNINLQFTQTRTEHNTRIMIVDDHNEYLKTAKGNHLK